jgi:hypothetical protein
MNMDMLYKYLGLTKTQIKLHQNQSSCAKTRWKNSKYKFKSGSKKTEFVDGFIGVLTSIKTFKWITPTTAVPFCQGIRQVLGF